ncbi:glycoside hydrolase family 27 protein [Gilvimarinus sp. SDUM040013]|uniref:Alpha-galactosidase n=1 Tax=Gilvimarinus gilvus TaxID=3058038 RepID=A0ABU4RZ81_9GAMM|nr:glycoside hydrolase family 27 protein [Gilvimarinus sp. SDUM040013]MDO3387552.1 glycoside hydrolase family 27 protein [Gilvimarinus sp. SDUM040013]MDX6850183.1 glycoside hydrolase family 27 protein [Gilvimarinus sp. SDUM040013]
MKLLWIKCLLAVVLSAVTCLSFAEKFAGLADTPAMGWNSWNTFDCDVDESMIRDMADAMVDTGMKDAGYTYINIDDCWHGERDAKGNIQVNKERFPSGMKALADYVHSKGLKLGIYSDAGNTTCAGYPGSRGHEYQDAKTYAAWGIDYLKYDWCDTENINPIGAYTTMRDALKAAGRPILYSICEWGDNQPWEWAQDIGHSWRATGDIYPCWDCAYGWGSWSSLGVLKILDIRKDLRLRQYAGPGHWNDYDMMEVGNGMSEAEDRSHFSLWAMLNSPLIAGNDLRSMSEATRKILTNKDIVALNQDPAGVEAMRYIDAGDLNVFLKPLANGEWAFLFLNRGDDTLEYTHDWQFNLVKDDLTGRSIDFNHETFAWRDLWQGGKGDTNRNLELAIPPHDVVVLRLTPIK